MKYRILGIIGLLIALNGAVGALVLWFVYQANVAEWFMPFASNFAQVAGGGALAWWGLKRWHGPLARDGQGQADREGQAEGEIQAEGKASDAKPRLGTGGLIFAIIGGLIMLFSGGCTLIFAASELQSSGGDFHFGVDGILIFGGVPFVVGLFIWLLAMASRKPRPLKRGNHG